MSPVFERVIWIACKILW